VNLLVARAIPPIVPGVRRELLVAEERVRDAEWKVEGDNAYGAREQLVEQLFRAPTWRAFREQTLVQADRIDSVQAVGDPVCGDGDDLPALVTCATRSAEVNADDNVASQR
jgi:hypothetical protein